MTSRDGWLQLMAGWGPVVFFTFVLPYLQSRRTRAVKQAGQLLLRVPRPRARRLWCGSDSFFLCILVAMWATLLSGTIELHELAVTAVPYTILAGVYGWFHWSDINGVYVEARKSGIVCGAWFCPWESIRGFRWLMHGPTLQLRVGRFDVADYRIAARQKDAMDHLLQENVPHPDKPQQGSKSSEAYSCG